MRWVLVAAVVASLPSCSFDSRGLADSPDAPVTEASADARPGAPDGSPAAPDARPDAAPAPDARAPDAAPPDATPVECPDDYVDVEGLASRYRYSNGTHGNWNQALADCADDLPGATHLVVIDDEDEDDAVDALSSNKDVWIGATDAAIEGAWMTALAAPLEFTSWAYGEPNDGAGNTSSEDCAELLDGGDWNDLVCSQGRRYVCECEPFLGQSL